MRARAPLRRNAKMTLYMQYGCGDHAPEGWLNFDASPTLRLERSPLLGRFLRRHEPRFPPGARYGDIVRGLAVAAASCDGVFCSHVLEHLALDDCRVALRNTYHYLRPRGIFRLVVPDLETLAREYLAAGDAEAAHRFIERSHLGRGRRARTPDQLLRQWIGNAAHLWMWDQKSMRRELADAGFVDIRRAGYGDCEDPAFAGVEDPLRFEGALAMQCRRSAT